MKRLVLIIGIFFSLFGYAQTDSLLLSMQDSTPKADLLPGRMIFTQRLLWGEKGLMRRTRLMPLNEANRNVELKIRRTMLVAHQVDGFVTLGCMVAQGIIGVKLYNYKTAGNPENDQGYNNLKDIHSSMAVAVNITYFSTAMLSLFAPPPLINRKPKRLNSITLHKYLAVVHFTSMLATNFLAGNESLKAYHRAAAYTAFASFASAMIVMKF